MHDVSGMQSWLAVAVLACVARAFGADTAASPFAPVAHSALVTLEAARTPSGLTLRVRHTTGAAPLSVTELAASIDGNSVPVTPRADGSWSVAWPATGAPGDGTLEVTVGHDGIREVLSGGLPPRAADTAAPGASGGVLHNHKQLAWWILNIAVVLVAAIAISRRMS